MTKHKQDGYAGIFLIVYFVIAIAGAVGWVWNIVKLIQSDFVMSGMVIARAIGIIVAPLGAVLGYC